MHLMDNGLLTLWSSAAAAALLAATWQGLVLTVSIGLGLKLLPGLSAARRALLWLAVFLVVVLLHFAPFAPLHSRASSTQHPGGLSIGSAWAVAVAAVWLGLSLYRITQLALSVARLRRIARRATLVPCEAEFSELLRSASRPVALYTSHDIDRPSVIGFRSSRILLPAALLTELSAAELHQVLLHEMEHLRRGDDWTNLLQKLVLILFPLNPALLWIERRLCTERELACDDGVLRRTHARKAYASCLARLAEHSVHSIVRRGASLALGAWDRQSELSQRVFRILRPPDVPLARTPASIVTGLLALLVVAGAGELAQSPELVRFAPAASTSMEAALPTIAPAQGIHTSLDESAPGARMATVQANLAERASVVPAISTGSSVRSAPAQPFDAPHFSLVKAVMPDPRIPVPAAPARNSRRRRAARHALARSTTQIAAIRQSPLERDQPQVPAHWLALTTWQQSEPATFKLAVQDDFWPSYAAVRVANGWLIFQL
jgi:beta-lactamase regulating signal transducer with metallopeptidase domain